MKGKPKVEVSVTRFLQECCEVSGRERNEDLLAAYGEFCRRRGYEPLNEWSLGRALSALGYPTGRIGTGRYRKGVRLKPVEVREHLADVPHVHVYDGDGRAEPPGHLSAPMAEWWRRVVDDFDDLDEHHLRILTNACEAWDRGQTARKALETNGLTYINSHGNITARPEVAIQEKAELSFARLVRELGIDGDAPAESDPRVPRIVPRSRRAS